MLHCRYHTLIWVVELYCVVVASYTMPQSFFEVRRCVVRHTLTSDVNEFLPCSWKYVLLMSWCFNFDDFPLFDKLTDIKIEPSTLLVESRDWFSAKQPCISSVSRIGTISKTPSECAPSIPSGFAVTRSLPYSCFIDLLCELLMMTSPHLHESGLAINTVSSVNICLVLIPRILLALSLLVPIRPRFLVFLPQAS